MKRKDLIGLYTTLKKLSAIKQTKFAYFVMKNLKILEPEINLIRELSANSKEYTEYEQKRIELCRKYAEKDEEGNPVIQKGNFQIKSKKTFENKINKLNIDYKCVLDDKKAREVEVAELLMEDTDLEFYKIKLENLPELSAKEMMSLEELIAE